MKSDRSLIPKFQNIAYRSTCRLAVVQKNPPKAYLANGGVSTPRLHKCKVSLVPAEAGHAGRVAQRECPLH